jgi:transposase-like protein
MIDGISMRWWFQLQTGICTYGERVDSEGGVLEVLVQPRRDGAAALRLVRKLKKRQGFAPTVIVTGRLRSMTFGLAPRQNKAKQR